jgi:cytosine/adenosine deaminase-related metal-dependent hydrolase
MTESANLARHYGVMLHTHLAETEDEEQFCREKYNRTPLQLMSDRGWSGKDVFFAHGIWFNDAELNLLAHTQTGVAHCPTSNMRLGSGIARITEMLEQKIRVGLGVDGSASNDTSDMLGEVRNAMLLQRVKYGADAMTARQAIKIAVTGGHDLLNFSNIGRTQEGFAADLAIFNMHQMQYAGALSDPVAALVFAGYNHETAYTIVNGKIVVREGKVVSFDEDEIFNKINEITRPFV